MNRLGWIAIAIVYLLTLLTQLPHIYDVYSSLERNEHTIAGFDTALGASIAFEASVAIFTLRTIVNTKTQRSRWTQPGIVGFLAMSALANLSYYFDLAFVDNVLMPGALVVAIPLALWLYAEEFGADARKVVKAQRKAERLAQASAQPVASGTQDVHKVAFACEVCAQSFEKQQGLAAHQKKHVREIRLAESPKAALEYMTSTYGDNGNTPLTIQDVRRIRDATQN